MKTLFFNPFERYNEKTLLTYGLLSSILGVCLAFLFNARFDGAIDLHFTEAVSVPEVMTDLINTVFWLSLFLFLAGKYINRKTRLIDIVCVVIIARIPFYILTFSNANSLMYKITEKMAIISPGAIPDINIIDLSIVVLFGILSIAFLVWFFILLWNGFKVASNAKGTVHVFLFVAAVLLAEVFSKILLYFIY